MPGVPRERIEHALLVRPDAKPVKQKLRRFAQDCKEAIKKEITRLLAAKFIREVYHPDWLANPVLVPKKNTKELRMCVDYTYLNLVNSRQRERVFASLTLIRDTIKFP